MSGDEMSVNRLITCLKFLHLSIATTNEHIEDNR